MGPDPRKYKSRWYSSRCWHQYPQQTVVAQIADDLAAWHWRDLAEAMKAGAWKIGRWKIQSSAQTACCEWVISTTQSRLF